MKSKLVTYVPLVLLFLSKTFLCAQESTAEVFIDPSQLEEEIDLTRFALGQGGLSEQPMFDAHVAQLAQLHPQTIRIFVQEYFDLYPEKGRYQWETLDRSLETILATGAKPIMSLCFKPKTLFPKIDDTIVHPTSYPEWRKLIYELVRHCNVEKQYGIEYWEVGNEPDIGENGGTPYEFTPEDYLTYYKHTVEAVLEADPNVKVGGPALANYESPIGDALIKFCGEGNAPLHFYSWHRYTNDTEEIRKTIRASKARLATQPSLKDVELIMDEWNMSLSSPILDPYYQPAYALETTHIFYEEGIARSAWYHIRDFYVDPKTFSKYFSPWGVKFMAHWWNVMPQYDGLFDHFGRVRPAYFAFKLMSQIRGRKVLVRENDPDLKFFAAKDESNWTHLVFWNFPSSETPRTIRSIIRFAPGTSGIFRLVRLNPERPVNNLEVLQFGRVEELEGGRLTTTMEPYEIRWIEIQ